MSESTVWPKLAVDEWADTRTTLHLWLQALGKVQLVSTPLINHWWNVTFEVSARGLRSRLMTEAASGRGFDAEFDFVEHQLVVRTDDGGSAAVSLEPKPVATFWQQLQQALSSLAVGCDVVASPNEVSPAIPFAQDTQDRVYDPAAATAWWRQISQSARVFEAWRAGFAGKASPVQLFWGSMDLSSTRFCGRLAPPATPAHPPNCPPYVMKEAEFEENIAAGFWPGGSSEGSFYAYVVPEPAGYATATLPVGYHDAKLGEWLLPYETVRTSDDPDGTLLSFLNSTYALAADLREWDRAHLDIDPHRLDAEISRRPDRRGGL